MDAKFDGVRCGGVQIHITDRNSFRPVRTGVHILTGLRAQDPDRFQFLSTSWEGAPPHLDLLTGTPLVRQGIEQGIPPDEITTAWLPITRSFAESRTPDLIYW
jgi:uncharacterized protein YbbC (DUF1343 family)